MNYAKARADSRRLFPHWSRRLRAKWVLARLKLTQPRVAISSGWSHDANAFSFRRTAN